MTTLTSDSSRSSGPPLDCYGVLRLKPGADAHAVEQAYWYLAKRYNAAIESDPGARSALGELNEAYRVLSSPMLRREYDFSRNIVPPGGQARSEAPPSVLDLASERARWPGGRPHPAPGPRRTLAVQRFELPNLRKPPWRKVVGGSVALSLGAVALVNGAEPVLIAALAALGLMFASLPVFGSRDQPAGGENRAHTARNVARPENLGDALIPRGMSRQTSRLVYQIYGQRPHLRPADVRTVTRYAILTQRFMETERRLRLLEEEGLSHQAMQVSGEQRALAAELRLHEATLNMTSVADEQGPTAG